MFPSWQFYTPASPRSQNLNIIDTLTHSCSFDLAQVPEILWWKSWILEHTFGSGTDFVVRVPFAAMDLWQERILHQNELKIQRK